MKKLSKCAMLELGIEAKYAGKMWAFTVVIGQLEGGALGIAVANEAGYSPVPEFWAHGTYQEMQDHADELNKERGLGVEEAMNIVCSSMAQGKVDAAPTDFMALARHAYTYAEEHYGDKDARFDVIVECMGKKEIADALQRDGITDYAAAEKWAQRRAGLHFEQELNQAWDGPESVKSSSRYDPAHDPAGPDFDEEEPDHRDRALDSQGYSF